MSIFKDKTLLITGGTGLFGHAVIERFMNTDIGEIRFFLEMKKSRTDASRVTADVQSQLLYR